MARKLINYTDELKRSRYYGDAHIIVAQGKGNNYLALFKVLEGTDASGRAKYFYQLEYRWLSTDCMNQNDEAYVSVLGREVQYYKGRELSKINPNILKGEVSLFDCFQLF